MELGAMEFHEQRRGPSRPLISRARQPLPPPAIYEKTMPAANAAVLGPEVSPSNWLLVSTSRPWPRKVFSDFVSCELG